MKAPILYLAGGLFNAGERLHNLYLEKYLKELGYEIILPQREALEFFKDGIFDVKGIVEDCGFSVMTPQNLLVGCIDGTDADSGTAVEFGMAIGATGRAIVYRTDFRTAPDQEVGMNAMFRADGSTFVYSPCYFTDLAQVDSYYQTLARKIDTVIKNWFK